MTEQERPLLFYDIEVFAHDTIAVFMDIDKNVHRLIHNDFRPVQEIVDNYTLCGYNNHYYDDKILTAMLKGWSPEQIKTLNDDIIHNRSKGLRVSDKIVSIDCFQQISVSRPGLKRIEANMGISIVESSISFDIDRSLTREELAETIRYCKHDVSATIDVYKLREYRYFKPKASLIAMLGDDKVARWNTTTITANLLVKDKLPQWSGLRLPDGMLESMTGDIRAMWEQENKPVPDRKIKKVSTQEFGCKIEFGFGGLHGVHKKIKRVENVVLCDVSSMYPSIIENINGLGEATALYSQIKHDRLAAKESGDKDKSEALKLILNSAYGLLNNQYSALYNPRGSVSVCVYGQIALYWLCHALSPYGDLININTDGVVFKPNRDGYKDVLREWEQKYSMSLTQERYDLWIQKDVNNYIAVDGNDIKTKGGDVGRYNGDNLFNNNQLRIVDIAIVDKLVHEVDVLDTLEKYKNQPKLFQYILQAGPTYEGTFDEAGKQYNRVNRVFAVTRNCTPTIYKRRPDGGLVRYPDTPDNMRIWNNDCSEFTDFADDMDMNWYYNLVMKKLEAWENE